MKKEINSIDILIAVARSGGVENVINMMTNYFCKIGINVRVVQIVYEGDEWLENKDCFNYLLLGKDGHTLNEFSDSYSNFIKLNGAPDIILAEAWPYMCYVAKLALSANKITNTKVYSHLHAPLSEYKRAGFGDISHLELSDGHLLISKMIRSEIEGVVSGRLIDIYNPVDFSKIDSQIVNQISEKTEEATMHDNKKMKLYYVGRISQEKRIETIINAVSQVKDKWELHIVGRGETEYEETIKNMSNKLSLGYNIDIFFHGWQSEPWKYAKDADYLVLASLYEGFSLVAVEAFRAGIPVISTPVGVVCELVEPGITGYLFPHNDVEMLTKILKCISDGIFPVINKNNCINKVEKYDANNALNDLYEKLTLL